METASVSHDEEHQHAVISFADTAKVQQNFEIAKYPRHISQIPHQWPSCRQICDSQRVIAPKNRYFRLFLPCFQTFL